MMTSEAQGVTVGSGAAGRAGRLVGRAAAWCVLAAAAGLGLTPASGQTGDGVSAAGRVSDAPDPFVAVAEGGAELRSGDGETWYVVRDLEEGTVLRVLGESQGWLEVAYPPGTPAVVRATDGELDAAAGVVTLTRRSPLLAYNAAEPFISQIFKAVLRGEPLGPGTELEYLGPVRDRDGRVGGFLVTAPERATGFVWPGDVRQPTDAEMLAAFPPEETPVEEDGADAEGDAAEDGDADGEGAAAGGGDGDGEEMDPADEAADEAAARADEGAGDGEGATAEAGGEGGEEDEEAPTVEERLIGQFAALDAAYERVMADPLETAEFEELMGRFRVLRREFLDRGMEPTDVAAIDARLELLSIRAEIQETVRSLAAIEAESDAAAGEVETFFAEVAATRDFSAVGRLVPSTIYDGDRLPRMYRLQSLDASAPRTIAYVIPIEGIGLEGMLGNIVGVRGEGEAAGSARVRVIRPTSAEILRR